MDYSLTMSTPHPRPAEVGPHGPAPEHGEVEGKPTGILDLLFELSDGEGLDEVEIEAKTLGQDQEGSPPVTVISEHVVSPAKDEAWSSIPDDEEDEDVDLIPVQHC